MTSVSFQKKKLSQTSRRCCIYDWHNEHLKEKNRILLKSIKEIEFILSRHTVYKLNGLILVNFIIRLFLHFRHEQRYLSREANTRRQNVAYLLAINRSLCWQTSVRLITGLRKSIKFYWRWVSSNSLHLWCANVLFYFNFNYAWEIYSQKNGEIMC